jgi:sucrose-6F-phosphate phosphohydrolase
MPHLNIRLFSTDLDGTLLGNPEAAWRFTRAWETLEPQRRPLLVYNTGRSILETRTLVAARHLAEPDFIIGGVGTELHDSLYNRSAEFRAQFGEGWDLAKVEQIVGATTGTKRQPPECSHAYKSSWTWPRARRSQIEQLESQLRDAGIRATVVYSCEHFLDVLPAGADKGKALDWLCRRLSVPLENVLVAGDTANDSSMFLLPLVHGILVENALPELFAAVAHRRMFVARHAMADGVLEGLAHFGIIAAVPGFEGVSSPVRPAVNSSAA